MLGYAMSPEDAFSVLRKFLGDARHRFLADDIDVATDRALRTERIGGANQVTDAYIAALAQKHSCKLATFDRELAAKAGIEVAELIT